MHHAIVEEQTSRWQTLTSCLALPWLAGSVAAAVAAMDMFPDHMYHEKLSAASEELSPRDHFASSAAATSCLPALVREFMKVG